MMIFSQICLISAVILLFVFNPLIYGRYMKKRDKDTPKDFVHTTLLTFLILLFAVILLSAVGAYNSSPPFISIAVYFFLLLFFTFLLFMRAARVKNRATIKEATDIAAFISFTDFALFFLLYAGWASLITQ